jgi:hypothetical protein
MLSEPEPMMSVAPDDAWLSPEDDELGEGLDLDGFSWLMDGLVETSDPESFETETWSMSEEEAEKMPMLEMNKRAPNIPIIRIA